MEAVKISKRKDLSDWSEHLQKGRSGMFLVSSTYQMNNRGSATRLSVSKAHWWGAKGSQSVYGAASQSDCPCWPLSTTRLPKMGLCLAWWTTSCGRPGAFIGVWDDTKICCRRLIHGGCTSQLTGWKIYVSARYQRSSGTTHSFFSNREESTQVIIMLWLIGVH